LQHADVVPGADARPEARDEGRTQIGEHAREWPVAVDRRVIERGRPAFQRPQEVERVEDLLPALVTAKVGGDRGAVADDFDAIDVALDRDGAERPPARDAVAVAIELDRLVLVHRPGLGHARVERVGRDRQRGGAVVLEECGH